MFDATMKFQSGSQQDVFSNIISTVSKQTFSISFVLFLVLYTTASIQLKYTLTGRLTLSIFIHTFVCGCKNGINLTCKLTSVLLLYYKAVIQ